MLEALEQIFQEKLSDKITIISCNKDHPEPDLSSKEKELLSQLTHPNRRASWLRGRYVLKSLLSQLGQDVDTAFIQFPNTTISLSHSQDCAIAAANTDINSLGIGIDVEFTRTIKVEMARFFLNQQEQAWINKLKSHQQDNLLRLWTVKEAIFKANINNKGTILSSYHLKDPAEFTGLAKIEEKTMIYHTVNINNAWITVAVRIS